MAKNVDHEYWHGFFKNMALESGKAFIHMLTDKQRAELNQNRDGDDLHTSGNIRRLIDWTGLSEERASAVLMNLFTAKLD